MSKTVNLIPYTLKKKKVSKRGKRSKKEEMEKNIIEKGKPVFNEIKATSV